MVAEEGRINEASFSKLLARTRTYVEDESGLLLTPAQPDAMVAMMRRQQKGMHALVGKLLVDPPPEIRVLLSLLLLSHTVGGIVSFDILL